MRLPAQLEALAAKHAPIVAVVGDLVQDVAVLLAGPIVANGQVDALISRHRGGSAANISSGLSSAGVRSRFYGRVGVDDLGRDLCEALAAEGVDVRARRSGSSCTVVCLVDPNGERSFVADTAAEGTGRSSADLPPADLGDLDAVHLSGYWLLSGVDLDGLALERRTWRDRFCLTMDLGNVSRVRACGPQYVRQLLACLQPDVVFANKDEAEAAQLLTRPLTEGLLVVTSGPHPTQLLVADAIVRVPVLPLENIVDTTGAGDAFVAGFLAAAAQGKSARAAVVAGHVGARLVIQSPGAGQAFGPWRPSMLRRAGKRPGRRLDE